MKTDGYIEPCEVVLADGTVTEFGELITDERRKQADSAGDLEARIHAAVVRLIDDEDDTIADAYPGLKRK